MEQRERWGLRAPRPAPGPEALDPLLAKLLGRNSQKTPRAALGNEYSKLSGTMKIGEIGGGKGRLLLLADSRQLKAAWRKPRLGKAAFPQPDFTYFHCARKLAKFRPQRSTRSIFALPIM